jgi:hypothetical protein
MTRYRFRADRIARKRAEISLEIEQRNGVHATERTNRSVLCCVHSASTGNRRRSLRGYWAGFASLNSRHRHPSAWFRSHRVPDYLRRSDVDSSLSMGGRSGMRNDLGWEGSQKSERKRTMLSPVMLCGFRRSQLQTVLMISSPVVS